MLERLLPREHLLVCYQPKSFQKHGLFFGHVFLSFSVLQGHPLVGLFYTIKYSNMKKISLKEVVKMCAFAGRQMAAVRMIFGSAAVYRERLAYINQLNYNNSGEGTSLLLPFFISIIF
jgi:hypothetical protein